jgi:phosphatidate cytidylyltransferase
MNLLFLLIAIHFTIGGAGIVFLNRKLPVEKRKSNWLKFFVYLFICTCILASILINRNIFLGIGIIICSGSLLELLKLGRQSAKKPSRNRIVPMALILFSILSFFFSLFILLPTEIIVYTYTIVVIFDGASQISGQATGKNKMLPVLSPNKTWEGLIGGTLSAVITAVILHQLGTFSVFQSLIFGLVVCLAAFIGDLAASAYKRAFDAKDFGSILPGQGGMLDRFDSFLVSGATIGLLSLFTVFRVNHFDKNIAAYLGFSLVFIAILLLGELMQRIFKIRPEFSRIFSHVLGGIVSLFMITFFSSGWYIVSLCVQSALFLYLTKRLGLLNAHHGVKRNTYGSSLFFFGILITYLISQWVGNIFLYCIPIVVLSISDPVASLTGLNRKSGFWIDPLTGFQSSKTYIGSLGFFISTLIVLLAGLSLLNTLTTSGIIIISLIIAFITAIVEAVSPNGTDNLSIPVAVALLLALFTG